ncbi:MAG: DNA repair protein RecN [Clostridia bacterium]|nr:DNA repair protein RecN [Clostridia bacterium]
MLKCLHIENIAVIEKSDIELTEGLNVLTGETGAGKSIIIDSINAVLGERTSKELIRAGCDKAEVSALFFDIDESTYKVLDENGFLPDDDGNLLIKRTLTQSGSTVKINGKPATAGILREIGKSLVNIHGQHDNQSLLDPQKHCGFIDRMAENRPIWDEYYGEFKKLNAIRREINELETDEDEKIRKIDLLKYQIKELEEADVKIGETDRLKEKLKLAESYEKTVKTLNSLELIFNGNDDENGVITKLEEASKLLSILSINELEESSAKLSDSVFIIKDVSENIRKFADSNNFSEEDIDSLQERLDLLHRLMLKYGDSEQKLVDYLNKAKSELEKIEFSDKKLNELSYELDVSTERLINLANNLTNSRIEASHKFADEVSKVLAYLDMQSVKFVVDIKKGRYTKNGCDEIEFLISANAGESVKPLHKIASGGELSRVMLAIKSVLSSKDEIPTLVFDEIDTGISGYAASKVGVQLKKVSKFRQVLCVTHLAQIAGFADTHFLISKNTENGRAFTNVLPLSYEEQINEIARIMSGGEITDNLYNSAKELLDRSKEYENL